MATDEQIQQQIAALKAERSAAMRAHWERAGYASDPNLRDADVQALTAQIRALQGQLRGEEA